MRVVVVIPCYKVSERILDVIARIGNEVEHIICVDDACPQQTWKKVETECNDQRVEIVRHDSNLGVGGAVMTGYRSALAAGADVVVKLDGDGQMDASLIKHFIARISSNHWDYAKGNRFHDPRQVRAMPPVRLFGNACLSFLTKLSSGYWHIFDPTNGYTAIHRTALSRLELERIDQRYFFESDMLFRLKLIGAVVGDVPMSAVYDDEESSLRPTREIAPFMFKNLRNFTKRVIYEYFLRDFNIGSAQLVAGLPLVVSGALFGAYHWYISVEPTTAGTVMLASLPILVGIQMLFSWISYDIQQVPRFPLNSRFVDEGLEPDLD